MDTEIKHRLLDLREEVNAKRDQEITVAKQNYRNTQSEKRELLKTTVVDIKAEYVDIYRARKAEMIIAAEATEEPEEA